MSLNVRNGMPLRRGLALWVAYNRALFKRVAGRDVLVLDVDRTLANPLGAGQALCSFLTATGVRAAGPAHVVEGLEPRLLRQQSAPLQGYAEGLARSLEEMYRELADLHGVSGRELPNPVAVPDWAAEALADLSENWELRQHAHPAPAERPSAWTRLRARLP